MRNALRKYSNDKTPIFFVLILGALWVLALGVGFFQKPTQAALSPGPSPSPTPPPPKVETYTVPILMYHYIREAPVDQKGRALSVSPKAFDDQVKWLREGGFVSIKVSDLSDPEKTVISKIYADKKKPVALSFDDGYVDAYTTAWPILQKYGFIGTFYIIWELVGNPLYLSRSQIDELSANGMEIGSHTLGHPELNRIPPGEAKRQIFQSRKGVSSFCYPFGKFNDTVENFVKEAGYLNATTTKEGIANQTSNLFELPRVRMSDMDFAKFKEEVGF